MTKNTATPSELVFAKKGATDWPWRDLPSAFAQSYRLADEARVVRAARAIGAGVMAMIAKDIVGHGSFADWLKTDSTVRFEGVNPESFARNVRRYMAAGRACLLAKKITPAAVKRSIFLRWAFDHSADGLRECPVWKAVTAYIGERSLWEIYVDEGIARERDPHQIHTPGGKDPETKVQLELGLVIETWKGIRSNLVVQTSTGGWEILPKADRLAFLEDAIPAVSNLALNTSWSPAERIAIHQRLVSITTALAAGKGGQ